MFRLYMRGLMGLVLGVFYLFPVIGQNSYNVVIDLKNINDDKVKVEFFVPHTGGNTVYFQLPDIVPGSYALYDYTSYIDEFNAYSNTGEKLPSKKNRDGQFVIKKAKDLEKIVYTVNDTWDADKTSPDYIFPPSGTQIEEGKVFLVNHFGFIGYLLGYENLPYSVTYIKPKNLHASSPLNVIEFNDTINKVENIAYDVLADNPVFYSNPDTLSFTVGGSKINITTYSRNKIVTSKYLKPILEDVTNSIKDFFTEMPVPEYSFYFYFAGHQEIGITKNQEYGALEHKYNSFYFLPEIPEGDFLYSTILEIATHEFLHIVTPLTLHSNEIRHFNFSKPEMSSHLWLYEGTVEYLSLWLLYTESLISKDDFILELRQKLIQAEKYADVSFTEMSKKITESPYSEMYNSVYNKGAIIAFLLDIEINQLTGGKKNLQKVLLELYDKYKDKPFEDDKLIDEIISLVHPDLKLFFADYVIGSKQLPIGNLLDKIGWDYQKEKKDNIYTFGNINLSYNSELSAVIIDKSNPKQNMFHFEGGEIIKSINGVELSVNNFEELSSKIINPGSDEYLTIEVEKANKLFDMEAQPLLMPAFELHLITDKRKKSSEQETLNQWIFSKQQSL